MSRDSGLDVRLAAPADAGAIRETLGHELADALERGGMVAICGIAEDEIRAGTVIREGDDGPDAGDGAGGGGGVGSIECLRVASGLVEEAGREAVRGLLRGVEWFLRERGVVRWVLSLEATAHTPIRAAESLGYRPTGRGPYREIGPGVVEYLHGYTGPEGFVVDFEPGG